MGENVPDSDHISRLCNPSNFDDDGEIDIGAFQLKMKKDGIEPYLSVNWLEYFRIPEREKQIEILREVLSKKLKRVPTNARIVVLNVGDICKRVHDGTDDNHIIEVLHQPEQTPEYNDESHSGIFNLLIDDIIIPDLLRQSILEEYPAKA
jgi:hypothetical protein